MADGTITLKAESDDKGVKVGMRDIEASVKRMSTSVEGLGEKAKIAIVCTEYSNHYSISVSHYNSFSICRNSFSTHSNIFGDRESELCVSFISKRSNASVWERVTILFE